MLPDMEKLSKGIKIERLRKDLNEKKLEDFIGKGLLNKMRENLEKQGMSNKKIEEEIKRFCMHKKKVELKNLENL